MDICLHEYHIYNPWQTYEFTYLKSALWQDVSWEAKIKSVGVAGDHSSGEVQEGAKKEVTIVELSWGDVESP